MTLGKYLFAEILEISSRINKRGGGKASISGPVWEAAIERDF
jgi:hypothetical protein